MRRLNLLPRRDCQKSDRLKVAGAACRGGEFLIRKWKEKVKE
jgi:hypothetical protein